MSDDHHEPGNGMGGNRPPTPQPRMSRTLVSWMVLLVLAMVLVTVVTNRLTPSAEITISQFMDYVNGVGNDGKGQIEELVIREEGVITGKLVAGVEITQGGTSTRNFRLVYPARAVDHDFLNELHQKLPGAKIETQRTHPFMIGLVTMLPWLLILGVVWFFIMRQLRTASGGGGMLGNFGRSRHRLSVKEHTNVTFADVAGIQEAKEEVEEIIEYLRAPKKFERLGGRAPRGVLLVGEPGCGKTLLAKAIAGEADVPFFSISGSDFVEMFVGVGASRVRDLFKQAKENSPCIIFLDEIDAVGRRRGANFGAGGHDEREQTLNAILVEMDGFESNQQVIVIAATNRADVLDPALIRPGRFDRQVFVSLPDLQGRYEILKVHARKIKLGPTVDMRRIARGTPMFSGAELAALVNEAALLAALDSKEFVEQEDLEEARDKVKWGRAKKSRMVDERDRRMTAYHEAGHALIQALEKEADPLHKVSIIPRGPAAGATFSLPDRDRVAYSKRYLLATMRTAFGGHIAEAVFFEDCTTGAASDIQKSTQIARNMVRDWGMGEKTGFVYYGDDPGRPKYVDLPTREYSDKTAELIDSEVHGIMQREYDAARRIMVEHKADVEAIAEALLRYETVTGEEVNALIRGETIQRASVSDLLDEADASEQAVGQARPVPAEPKPETDLGNGTLPQPG